MKSPSRKFRYEELTWPEVREVVLEQPVTVIPVGTIEQHGPHLPLITDACTATEMSRMAVERTAHALLMPTVSYAFNEHHLDFPGTIAIDTHPFINYVVGIGKSLSHHGFRKILIVNGHGSNVPFMDIAARTITNHTEAICALVSWWSLIPQNVLQEIRESEFPGGMAHGCELETSVMLQLRPDLVQMHKAEKDIHFEKSNFIWWDLQQPSPVTYQEWFSRYSKTGTVGDPTKASSEKGKRVVEAVVSRLAEFLDEFRLRTIYPRVDHH
ncbi:MAG: creatininase family protein [Acidobacteria bacterium]|nr:creatininase family protein [Acidobacteriota bacterium]